MIVATLFLSGIAMATPVKAGDIDCDVEPNDVYCTGEEGAGGMRFCDLVISEGVPINDRLHLFINSI